LAKYRDGDGDRATGETWIGIGKGSDADVIKGMSPLTVTECVSGRLLTDRGASDDGLRSALAGVPNARWPATAFECSESVGVECEGTGGDTETSWLLSELDPLFFNSRPGEFIGEGEPATVGGLHCSDTHCTCPGGLVCKADGDGDPVLNLSKPRPRL